MADTHIGLAVIFDVPEGQDTATHKANFYAKSRKGTKDLIYYGFASLGNKVRPSEMTLYTITLCQVMCREGYKSALGFQAHVMEVKDDLEAIIKQVGRERVKVFLSCLESFYLNTDFRLSVVDQRVN